jgi:glycerophosphoryl diester phosphodiesterase
MSFLLQGHRGARGLRPENTLPSFEAALDCGVSSIETDLHLTADGAVILCHDPHIAPGGPLVAARTLAELRSLPPCPIIDPTRFPRQSTEATPLAQAFAALHAMDVFGLPTLDDLLAFVSAYAGAAGRQAGKSEMLRRRAAGVVLDLELKRVPGRPEWIGDHFDGFAPGRLERQIVDALHRHGALEKTVVRSFDHRSVAAIKRLESRLLAAVLVAGTAPAAPEQLAQAVGASIYCPAASFVDPAQIGRLHAQNIRVLPWTVNDPADWERLLTWGVDGITTDEPDLLARVLDEQGIAY